CSSRLCVGAQVVHLAWREGRRKKLWLFANCADAPLGSRPLLHVPDPPVINQLLAPLFKALFVMTKNSDQVFDREMHDAEAVASSWSIGCKPSTVRHAGNKRQKASC